jgi:hypothetical protein
MPVPAKTPVSLAVGAHQYAYVFHGKGRPDRIDLLTGDVVPAGINPPAAPVVTAAGGCPYYVARVDVVDYGAQYHTPPEVVIGGDGGTTVRDGRTAFVPPGIDVCERPATARAFLRNGQVNEIIVTDYGKGYSKAPTVYLSGSHASGLVLEAVLAPLTGDQDASTPRPIESVTVVSGGSGYLTPPVLDVESASGYGALLSASVTDGTVTAVSVLAGGAYTSPPAITPRQGGAAAVAVARAHLRGTYQCYYRYVDDTPPERGGPVCSNLSPACTVDCGEGAEKLVWSGYTDAPIVVDGRTLTLERWRTTGSQSFTLYRLTGDSEEDTLTDEELRDPDRPGYLGLPILLPNGELNANRFGVPPSEFAAAVMFQDRLWCSVDTTGARPTTLMYSEVDEPESIPDINELILQTNVKGSDHITALIPFGGTLGVMQARHFYRITYVSQPLIDVNVAIGGYRGCLNQRCWDEHEGVVYAMDTQGVYAMDSSGSMQPISDGIIDLFTHRIDFTKSGWFSVTSDTRANCLRVAVRFLGDGDGDYPTRLLCFSFKQKAWWEERYPAPLVGAAAVVLPTGERQVVYGTDGGRVYRVNAGTSDTAVGGVGEVTITNRGSGYTRPPRVTASGGDGAVLESVIGTDGSILAIYVRQRGYGYSGGALDIEPPEDGEAAAASYATVDGSVPISYSMKTGNMEYPNDSIASQGLPDQGSRNVAVLFTPTEGPAHLKLRLYYNNKDYPRVNVVDRDRGSGFEQRMDEPGALVNLDAGTLPENISSGVCRALFAGKTLDDVRGNDRHVAVELCGEIAESGPVVIHQMDVFGVPSPQGG